MWDQIKEIIDTIGGKFVIAEGGKPRYIVLAFEEFKKLIHSNSESPIPSNEAVSSTPVPQAVVIKQLGFARQREEFGDTPESINQKIADLSREEEEARQIKIEDLPF